MTDRGAARPWLVDLAEDGSYEVLVNALSVYADRLRHDADQVGGSASMLTMADRADELRQEIEEALDR